MAQKSLETSGHPQFGPLFSSSDPEIDDMKPGIIFPDEDNAVQAILRWGEKAFCPLAKARRDKGLAETGGKKRGRRCLDCPHGRNRKGSDSEKRPKQNLKYTKCPVSIVINENDDGSWEVTKAILEHYGHPVSKKDYYMHEHTKRLQEEDRDYLKDLMNAKANPKNIAACLSQKTGKQYNGQDVRNLIKKIDESDLCKPKAEEILRKIKDAGGNVLFTKDVNKQVDVLWIPTAC